MKQHVLLSLFFTLIISSCGKKGENLSKVLPGFWGHLEQVEKSDSTKLFLIHLKDQADFNVCLAQEMSDKLPGVEEEIKASINIWGHYIGRKIRVNITKRTLLNEVEKYDLNKLTDKNYDLCPSQTDIVVGFAKDQVESNWVGITTYTYYTKKPPKQDEISRYKRGLFLRQGEVDKVKSSGYKWISLNTHFNKVFGEDELLNLLIDRKSKIYLPDLHEKISLRVLVHEFGHVWGLCDQYYLDKENKTNCDPAFSSLDHEGKVHIHEESTMSTSGWINDLYLSEDDITGIRELAERNFGESFKQEKIDNILIQKEAINKLEHLSYLGSEQKEGILGLRFAIKSDVNLNIHLSFFDKVKSKWFVYNPKMLWKGPALWNDFTWTFNLDQLEEIGQFKMIITSPELKGETVITGNI
jgi:predicted Zn-dependent protease with MMP-like domain